MTASGERAPVPYPEQGFGRSVRLLRLRRGWTQRQLAERAGITGPGVSRIEKGANGSNLATAWRIAEALGADLTAMIREQVTG